jgi:hypothetical protein
MKTAKTIILVLMVLALMVLIAACKKAPAPPVDQTTNVAAPAETAPVLTAEEQELATFKADKMKAVEANDKVIADYKAKMTDATGKMMAKYDKKIEALELKNTELKTKLEEAKYTDKTAWDTFKMDIEKTITKLGTDLKKYEPKDNK